MALALKIITSLLAIVLPAAVLIRDWRFHDRRTAIHSSLTRWILVFWAVSSFGSVGIIWYETYQSNGLSAKIDDLVVGKNALLASISTYQRDLAAKDAKIQELTVTSEKASRGITDTFDFDGARRNNRPGVFSMDTETPEAKMFQELFALQNTGNYLRIISLCEQKIQSTPDWLTPYMFLGISYVNLGAKEKGIGYLEYVREHSFGNPDFAQAEELLKKLR